MPEIKLEEALNRLEEITKNLESPDLELDEAMKHYEEGLKLIKNCSKLLNKAEARLVEISGNQLNENNDVKGTENSD